MNDKDRLDFLLKDAVQGFTEYCGLESVSLEPGLFVTRVRLEKQHLQQDGFVHAGLALFGRSGKGDRLVAPTFEPDKIKLTEHLGSFAFSSGA